MSPPDPAHGRGNRRFHAGNNGTLYVAGETLYKVATNERSGERLRRESRLLAHIAGRLAAPVPVPVEVLWDEHDSAPVTVKYRLIHGKELPVGLLSGHAELARQVAAFLTSLHTVEWARLRGILEVRSAASELARVREATGRALASSLPARAYDTVVDWWETSEGRVDEWPAESLVHGDFWSGNIIVDDALESVRGVIDFVEAHVGDPAEDFAALFHAGPAFTSEVLLACSRQRPDFPLGSLVERASWWWELREFQGISRGLEAHDEMQVEDALAKLRVGPLFDPRVAFPRYRSLQLVVK